MPEGPRANPVHKKHIQSHPTSHLVLRRPKYIYIPYRNNIGAAPRGPSSSSSFSPAVIRNNGKGPPKAPRFCIPTIAITDGQREGLVKINWIRSSPKRML